MNSRKLSRLIGVFTTAIALMQLLALSIDHQQTNGASIRPEVADGSGPVPKPPRNMFLADGSGPVPKPPRNVFLADGSGPVPKPPRNVFLADGSGPVPKPPRNMFLADGSGPVVPPVQPTPLPNVLAA